MRVLKIVFDFYLNSSIHVALAVYALSWITLKEFDLEYDEDMLYFNFYATISGYNFVKYFGLAKFHHRSLASWLRTIQIFSFLCFLALGYYAFKLETETLFWIFGFGVVTFLYAIPFLPKHLFLDQHQNLRGISGLKVYIIALVWSGVTVLLPLINHDFSLNYDVVITFVQRFLLVIVLMLPFEIRDMKFDSLKLSTIPQQIGVIKSKAFGLFILIIFLLLEYFKNSTNSNVILIQLGISAITALSVTFAFKNQGKYYSAFFVESIPIIWLLLLIVSC